MSDAVTSHVTDFSRADWILLFLPVLFVTTYSTSQWMGGQHVPSVGVATLVCVPLVVDALFVHPPNYS